MIRIDRHIYEGRPADETGRTAKELRVYDLLDSLSIPFKRMDHEAAMTMADCEEVRNLMGVSICKNLFLTDRRETKYFLLLMPGHKRFLTREFSPKVGSSRLSFGKEEMMLKLLDLTPGSASIMGLMNDTSGQVTLAIDREVLEAPLFACHPSINTSSILLSTADVLNKFLPATGHEPIIVDLTGEG